MATYSFQNLVDRYNNSPAAQDFGVFATYDPATNTFIEDVSSFGFTGDAATKTYTPDEFMGRLGLEGGTFEPSSSVSPYESGEAASSFYGSFPDTTEERQPLGWWDVEDPKAYFGIKGERTDEQKDLVRRFRQEWSGGTGVGARGGANAINAFIEGSVTADQLSSNWGSENLQAIIKAGEFSSEAFQEGGNFGEYLRTQWANVSEFMGGTGIGPDGSLGSLSTSPSQIAGDKGRLSADDYAQQAYLDNIRAAAEQAGIAIDVEGPSNSAFELNVGQFDDVALGEYKQVRDYSMDVGDFVELGVKFVLSMALTGGVAGAFQALASGTSAIAGAAAGITGAFQNIMALGSTLGLAPASAQSAALEAMIAAHNEASLLAAYAGGSGVANLASVAEGVTGVLGTLENIVGAVSVISEVTSNDDIPNSVLENEDIINTALTEGVEAGLEAIDTTQDEEEEVVSLDADKELMGTTEEVVEVVDEGGGVYLTTDQEADFNLGKDVVLDDGTIVNNQTHEILSGGFGGGVLVTPTEIITKDNAGGGGSADSAGGAGGADSANGAGGADGAGGGSDNGTAESKPWVVRNGPWVYTGEGGYWVLIDPDVLAQEGIVSESNGISQVSEEIYTNPDNWVDVKEDPNWTEDGDYVFSSGELGDVTGGEAAEGDVSEEEELSLIDILNTSSSDGLTEVVNSVINDGSTVPVAVVTPDTTDTTDTTNTTDTTDTTDTTNTTDTTDTTNTTDTTDTTKDSVDTTDTETVTEDGDKKVTDGEENGDDNNGNGDNGNGDDGDGGDGDDGGDEGDGGLGLSGGGLFSLEAPSIFEPSYKPLDYDTQLLKPRMFDFIDYNPLRNIR